MSKYLVGFRKGTRFVYVDNAFDYAREHSDEEDIEEALGDDYEDDDLVEWFFEDWHREYK